MTLIIQRGQRLLALREAELLRGLKRDTEADDAADAAARGLAGRSAMWRVAAGAGEGKGDDRWQPRTLKQAMALGVGRRGLTLVEEQETIMAGDERGGARRAPFNHLLSSMRQSALLLRSR